MTLSVLRHTPSRNVRQAIHWERSLTLSRLELQHYHHRFRRRASQATSSPWIFYPSCMVLLGAAGFIGYNTSQPFRHTVLAVVRCSRVAGERNFFRGSNISLPFTGAAVLSGFDYKATMITTYDSVDQEAQAYLECHTRSAKRVLKALLANGGLVLSEHTKSQKPDSSSSRYFHQARPAYGFFGCTSQGVDTNHGRPPR